MAMIWPCELSVEAYAEAGKQVVVPRQRCPRCAAWMIFSSGYFRSVRAGRVFRIWVRRARCQRCDKKPSHALLPSFCLVRRLDAVGPCAGIQPSHERLECRNRLRQWVVAAPM